MISKLVTPIALLFMTIGCRSRDIRQSHVITDLSKPVTLTFQLKGSEGNAGYRIKGFMNGTLGYSDGLLTKGYKFPSYNTADNIGNLGEEVLRDYVRLASDSIKEESSSSIGQSGLIYGLHFIPGTATKGKIEVEFWEHPTGFY